MSPAKRHLCFLLSNGFSARMISQTDLLAGLAARGFRLTLLVPDATDASLQFVSRETGAELLEYHVRDTALLRGLFQLRKFVLNDIEANPALLEKYMVRRQDPNRSLPKRIFDRLEFGAYRLAKALPFLREGFHWLEQKILRDPAAEAQLRSLAPDLLVCTYPVMNPEPEYLLAARAVGIPTVLHLLSWDNITAKGRFPALADHYAVWGDCMAEELREYYGVGEERITRLGVPHFDLHVRAREQADPAPARELGLDPERPYLFFAMSAPRYCPREIDIVERLAGQIADGDLGVGYQLLVRPHPQNMTGDMADKSWLPRLQALEELDNVHLFYPNLHRNSKLLYSMAREELGRFSQLLAGAALILNSGSTVSIDALMAGRPVVLTSFDAGEVLPYWQSARRLVDYTHLKKFVACRGVKKVSSFKELDAAINTYLREPDTDMALREATIAHYCLRRDGRATERAVDFYQQFLLDSNTVSLKL